MSRLTKILAGIALLAVVVLVGFGLWTVFFQPLTAPTGPRPTDGGTPTGGLPPAGENANRDPRVAPGGTGTLPDGSPADGGAANANTNAAGIGAARGAGLAALAITSAGVVNPTLAANGQDLRYYDRTSGKFFARRTDGTVAPLSDRVFYQVSQVTWSPDRSRALLEYPDGANIIYDFKRDRAVTVPAHWEAFSFSPRGDALVAKSIASDPDNIALVTTDAEGSSVRVVASLGHKADAVIPAWSPADTAVAMLVEHLDGDRQEIFFFGKNDENYKSVVVEGWGFSGRWTPTGDRLLYSTYRRDNGERPMLAVVDASPTSAGRNRTSLGVQTWADQCTFADNLTAYCAVPRSLPEGAGLFPEQNRGTPDDVYLVNLNTGTASLVASPAEPHAMANLLVSADGRTIYFTDPADGRLYELAIP